jgi:hypothetical protein
MEHEGRRSGGEMSVFSRDISKDDIWAVGAYGVPQKSWNFRIDYRGRVVLNRLPFLVWLMITGVASSVLSVLTVWVVWG